MNRKHDNTAGAASIAAWMPGNLIAEINEAVSATGQKRSYLVAEAVRHGLPAARDEYLKSNDGKSRGASGMTEAVAKAKSPENRLIQLETE